MKNNNYSILALAEFQKTPISRRIKSTGSIVLERIAKGGGATIWYFCGNESDLKAISSHISPGSAVSFYFDSSIKNGEWSERIQISIRDIILKSGDAVVGVLNGDNLHIDMEVITGPGDLADYVSTLPSGSRVYYGAFPPRGNDGENAVTLDLPDADGVIRSHPH